MPGNDNLHQSKTNKQDEFYTPLPMIENELQYYRQYFKGATVFCNADDPAYSEDGAPHYGNGGEYTSEFFRYFMMNFEHLGLKKLISTHYDSQKPTYKLEVTGDQNGDGQIDRLDIVKTPLDQNGDFASPECRKILEEEADIVVTNPPFSQSKKYIPMLLESGKKFLVLGNLNHITFKEIFHYVFEQKLWLGVNSGHYWFRVPSYYGECKIVCVKGLYKSTSVLAY